MSCVICEHSNRCKIEDAILRIDLEDPSEALDKIAEQYNVSPVALKQHALFHTPKVNGITLDESEVAEVTPTLARQMKLKEAESLEAVVEEYMTTLKVFGGKVRSFAEGEDTTLARCLTKPIADTYINLGGEIRQTIRTMAEINQMLNGKPDSGAEGLAALVSAIGASHNDKVG